MTCTRNFDDFDMVTTTTYDAFGNVVSEEEQRVLRADVPVILSPPGTSEFEVEAFEYRFDGTATNDTPQYIASWFCDPQHGFGLCQCEACQSNLIRFHEPGQIGDIEIINPHYNGPRRFDPTIGRWLAEEPLGFQASDDNMYPYPRQQMDPNS